MRVLIADKREEVRSGIRVFLEQEDGISGLGEAGKASELIEKVLNEQPDMVLLDWELPGLKANEMIQMLRSLCPGLRIIALSGRPESRTGALDAGADGFISKGDQPEKILAEINILRTKGW